MIISYFNSNSPNYNINEKEKDAISTKFKKKNNLPNEDKSKSLERTMKKDLELDEPNLTEIMPDSLFSKNNNIFKDFNNFFFKNNLNEFNKKNCYE